MTAPRAWRPAARRAWLVLLALYGAHVVRTMPAWHLPDFLNLPIHETGHLVFSWGGDVLAALGGTLFQLLVPAAFAASFHRRGDALGTATCAWWGGQSLVNVARYVADARAQALPLVGGGEHDWTFLLATWGMLHRDAELAAMLRLVAALVMAVALWHGWRHADDRAPEAPRGGTA